MSAAVRIVPLGGRPRGPRRPLVLTRAWPHPGPGFTQRTSHPRRLGPAGPAGRASACARRLEAPYASHLPQPWIPRGSRTASPASSPLPDSTYPADLHPAARSASIIRSREESALWSVLRADCCVMLLVCCQHSVTWPDSLRWISVEPLGPGLPQLPGFQLGREVPNDHYRPIHRARHDPAQLFLLTVRDRSWARVRRASPPICTGINPPVRSVGGAQNGIICRVGYLLASARRSSAAQNCNAWARQV
jgi:hypothetical protein